MTTKTNGRAYEASDLFVGKFPTGLSYADRTRTRDGDYVGVAFLPYGTLELEVRDPSCPAGMIAAIMADAALLQARRGEQYEVNTCGQTVLLGGRPH